MRKAKKPKKITKALLKKRERTLARKCLKLWATAVKMKAGNVCCVSGCDATEHLNAHHIESKFNCKALRFDIRNGLCACPRHHKFSGDSFHKSLCATLEQLTADDIDYLTAHRHDQIEITMEYLTAKAEELQRIIASCAVPPPSVPDVNNATLRLIPATLPV